LRLGAARQSNRGQGECSGRTEEGFSHLVSPADALIYQQELAPTDPYNTSD
jgi:hypothetical protein